MKGTFERNRSSLDTPVIHAIAIMHKLAIVSCILAVSACAHQPADDTDNRSKRAERMDDTQEQQSHVEQDCRNIGPSLGSSTGGTSLGITDCDVMAVDRAAGGIRNDASRGIGNIGAPIGGQLPRTDGIGL